LLFVLRNTHKYIVWAKGEYFYAKAGDLCGIQVSLVYSPANPTLPHHFFLFVYGWSLRCVVTLMM